MRGRERERERERDACDVIDITLKSRVIMHIITSTAHRPYASTRSEPVECSSACKDKELWCLSARTAGSSDWWMTMGSRKLCVRWSAAVDHPAAFRWHASSKKNRPSWCLFPFRMAPVLPLRTAWIADILSQASPRDVERQRYWKRGSGDGQRLSLWDYGTTEQSINVVDRRGSTLTWTVCKAIGSSR